MRVVDGRGRPRRHPTGYFELTDKSGKTGRFDEVALQEWRGDRIFRERFFYDPARSKPLMSPADTSIGIEAM